MAWLTTVDVNARRLLRPQLQRIAGVERVLVDDEGAVALILGDDGIDRAPILEAGREVLESLGIDPADVALDVVVRVREHVRQRVRFERVERILGQDGSVRVRVVLAWGGKERVGHAIGERGELIEQRIAALAALDALERLIEGGLGLRLAGIKQQRAFDTDLMVVSLYQAGPPPRRFIGAVLVQGDPLRAAVMAVLNALNRTLGNFIDTND